MTWLDGHLSSSRLGSMVSSALLSGTIAPLILVVLTLGCSMRVLQMPADSDLVEAQETLEELASRAEEVGVWEGLEGNREGVASGHLEGVFRYYAHTARDFPEDKDRVGNFVSSVLVPTLLRACDAVRRDVGPVIAGNIESIMGELFVNRLAMERWAPEIERRLIEGEGFHNLYWARVLRSGCARKEIAHAKTRYEVIFEQCRERGGGCDPKMISTLEKHLRIFDDPKERKHYCR